MQSYIESPRQRAQVVIEYDRETSDFQVKCQSLDENFLSKLDAIQAALSPHPRGSGSSCICRGDCCCSSTKKELAELKRQHNSLKRDYEKLDDLVKYLVLELGKHAGQRAQLITNPNDQPTRSHQVETTLEAPSKITFPPSPPLSSPSCQIRSVRSSLRSLVKKTSGLDKSGEMESSTASNQSSLTDNDCDDTVASASPVSQVRSSIPYFPFRSLRMLRGNSSSKSTPSIMHSEPKNKVSAPASTFSSPRLNQVRVPHKAASESNIASPITDCDATNGALPIRGPPQEVVVLQMKVEKVEL